MKTKIADIGLERAIIQILPHMVAGGELAKAIQKQLKIHDEQPDQKDGDRFHSALTDADILVESYIGAKLFLAYDDIKFEGEEKDSDHISPYFPETAEYVVTLDPVNGTFLFKNGLPIFDMIMTFNRNGKLIAAIDYVPCQEKFFIAIENMGAFTTTKTAIENNQPWVEFQLPRTTNKVFTHRTNPELTRQLNELGFEVIDLNSYKGGLDWNYTGFSLLTGEVCAMVKPRANLIDWGAIAFIAGLAGGKCNMPTYDPTTLRTPLLLVAHDEETYEKISQLIN